MIFPAPMIKAVRKAVVTGTVPAKVEGTGLEGIFVEPPVIAECPIAHFVGLWAGPIWCSNCGEEVAGKAIKFGYNLWPKDGRSEVVEFWIHESC